MRLLESAEGEVLALAFSPDGRALVGAVENQGVFLWDLTSTSPPTRLDPTAAPKPRISLSFSGDGQLVHWLSGHQWRTYDRESRQTTSHRLDARGQLYRVIPAPESDRVFSQHDFPEHPLIGWRRDGRKWAREWEVSTEHLAIEAVTVGPAARQLAMLTRKTVGERWWQHPFRLELRSAVSTVVEATGVFPYTHRCPLAFSPSGEQLVGVHEMTLLVWSVPELGEPLLIRNDTRKHFTAAAYHPSGKHLFVASNDATVHIFDTTGWGRPTRFTWNLGRLRAVAISPDGGIAAAGGDHGEVIVWDLEF
jgi:WD40 repeat protein